VGVKVGIFVGVEVGVATFGSIDRYYDTNTFQLKLRHQYISVKISYLACKLWASLVFAVCDVRVGVANFFG